MDSCSPQCLLDAAEEQFMSGKANEAYTLASRAKQLHPQLAGIDNLIAAYGVHFGASTKKSNGDLDWYAVLGLFGTIPVPDIETCKKNYKKLALMVHPDKNRSAAAEGAFKLISRAWEVLSAQAQAQPSRAAHKSTPSSSSSATPTSAASPSSRSASSTTSKSKFGCRGSSSSATAAKKARLNCFWCNSPCFIERSTESVSVWCAGCNFSQTVKAKRGWKPLWGVTFDCSGRKKSYV